MSKAELNLRQARKRIEARGEPDLTWYVLRCPPQKESALERVLSLRSFVAAIPTIQRERRAIRQGKPVLRKWRVPVMPGYVMTGFPTDTPIPWFEINNLHLVNSVLSRDGHYCPIPYAGIRHLIGDEMAVRIGASKYMRVWREYVTGDRVRVETGPFYGHEGKVVEVTDTEARIFLSMFGQEVPVTIPVGDATKSGEEIPKKAKAA